VFVQWDCGSGTRYYENEVLKDLEVGLLVPHPDFMMELARWLAPGSGFGEGFLEAFHACAGGGFRNAHGAAGLRLATMPVSLEAHCKVIAIALECLELAYPVDDATADRRPLKFAVCLADGVFAVAMTDAVLWKVVVVVGIGSVAGKCGGVSGIPVEHEVGFADSLEDFNRLGTATGIAGHFVFENQHDIVFGACTGRVG